MACYQEDSFKRMIINHKYKFIFLKTMKTAGTSIEIALSQLCDTKDIITISNKDKPSRQELGFKKLQNNVPLSFYSKLDWLRYLKSGKRKKFFNHANAQFIRENVEEDIWQSYFKFSFERNPFDKAISLYYYCTSEPRPELSDFLNSVTSNWLSNWNIYTINDQIAVDFVGRYENLAEDLARVKDKLGFYGELSLPKAKGDHRLNRDHYSNVLNEQDRARIELVCAKEILAFDYSWDKSQDK